MDTINLTKRTTKATRLLLICVLLLGLSLGAIARPTVRAATPGLPFIEDFSDTALRESTLTNANWSTDEQTLVLAWRRVQYEAFGPGLAGSDVSADPHATWSVALGDVDGDGDLDLVAGNDSQANRLYRRALYHTGQGRAGSPRVDTETGNIAKATLTPTASLPPNTGVTYWLSNNGGAQWFIVQPDVRFVFPTAGVDLRWRAELHSLSPVRTPRIEQIVITGNQTPIANAGSDQNVDTNALVTLNDSGSSDPDGDLPLIYTWTQTGGPAVTLSNPAVVAPTFTAPSNPADRLNKPFIIY